MPNTLLRPNVFQVLAAGDSLGYLAGPECPTYPTLDSAEGEISARLGHAARVGSYFVTVFKNGVLFGVYTHDGVKTFEAFDERKF